MSMNVGGAHNQQPLGEVGQTRMGVMEYMKACKPQMSTGELVAKAIKYCFSGREARSAMAKELAPTPQQATIQQPPVTSKRDELKETYDLGVESFNRQNKNGRFNDYDNILAFCKLSPEELKKLSDQGHGDDIEHISDRLQGYVVGAGRNWGHQPLEMGDCDKIDRLCQQLLENKG